MSVKMIHRRYAKNPEIKETTMIYKALNPPLPLACRLAGALFSEGWDTYVAGAKCKDGVLRFDEPLTLIVNGRLKKGRNGTFEG
jgi:hypothetical protein